MDLTIIRSESQGLPQADRPRESRGVDGKESRSSESGAPTQITREFGDILNQRLACIVNYAGGARRRLQVNAIQHTEMAELLDEIATEALRAGTLIRETRDELGEEPPAQMRVESAQALKRGRDILPSALQTQ